MVSYQLKLKTECQKVVCQDNTGIILIGYITCDIHGSSNLLRDIHCSVAICEYIH